VISRSKASARTQGRQPFSYEHEPDNETPFETDYESNLYNRAGNGPLGRQLGGPS
jgi:hypothetical protein